MRGEPARDADNARRMIQDQVDQLTRSDVVAGEWGDRRQHVGGQCRIRGQLEWGRDVAVVVRVLAPLVEAPVAEIASSHRPILERAFDVVQSVSAALATSIGILAGRDDTPAA